MNIPPTASSATLACAVFLASGLFATAALAQVPVGFPPPTPPAGNPFTVDKALLGKALFWDEQLSVAGTTACGTCHIFSAGGADPRSAGPNARRHPGRDRIFGTADDVIGSPGVVRRNGLGHYQRDLLFGFEPQVTERKAPSVINAGYARSLFWDGRARTTPFRDPITGALTLGTHSALESAASQPPVNDVEMGRSGHNWTDIEGRLAAARPLALATNVPQDVAQFIAGARYPDLFQRVYGSSQVTATRAVMAIATYIRTLNSDRSLFDDMLTGTATFTPEEANGRALFRSHCVICHADIDVYSHFNGPGTGVFEFSKTGVRPAFEDPGAGGGEFRIPFLRNVALRTPLFHNGGAATLADVVEFYDRGGDFSPSAFLSPLNLTQSEKDDLVDFMETLTDPRVAAELPPFDRPTLYSESNLQPTEFGAGTAGSGGFAPQAMVFEPPYLGNPRWSLGVHETLGGTLAILMWDSVADAAGTSTFGIQLHLGRSPDFVAITAPALTRGTGAGAGSVDLSLAIPDSPALQGLAMHGQWAVLDPNGPQSLASSAGFSVQLF